MKPILAIEQDPTLPGLGLLGRVVRARGLPIVSAHAWEGDLDGLRAGDFAGIVPLGGSMQSWDEERLSFVRAHFVNGDDVRVLKTGRQRRFRAEPLRLFLARLVAEQEHLHRDNAAEALLPRLVNDTHAAAGDFFEQFVVAEGQGTESGGRRSEVGGRGRSSFRLLTSDL